MERKPSPVPGAGGCRGIGEACVESCKGRRTAAGAGGADAKEERGELIAEQVCARRLVEERCGAGGRDVGALSGRMRNGCLRHRESRKIARRAGMADGGEDTTPALEAGRGRRSVAVGGKQLGTYAVVLRKQL